ncbi:ROK family protein [candidate division WWE3 bacterium]|uniref:ROK family protein n=1 Tax=candidate division WWE3 bacterium TaxID=2053526 RepID=A0A955RQH2_UNCKA|nr:ROK family protein [candidate division WWE3 bacterium]
MSTSAAISDSMLSLLHANKKDQPMYLGVDIGGTNVVISTFNKEYSELSNTIYPTKDLVPGSIDFVTNLKRIIENHLDDSIKKIGVSFNCIVNDGVVVSSSILGGMDINYPLVKELEAHFNRKVQLENDVICQGKAELHFGYGKDAHSFVLVNIGTGLRLVYIVNNEVQKGWKGCLGEIFYMKRYIPELQREVDLEKILSGRGLEKLYFYLSGSEKPTKEIIETVQTDDSAKEAVKIFINQLTKLLTDISRYYNPQLIIFTGGVTRSSHLFLEKAIHDYDSTIHNFHRVDGIQVSELQNAACLGAIL